MKSNWEEVIVKEILDIPSRNGLSKPKSVRGNGYKMVNMGEIFKYNKIYNIEMERVPLTEKEKEVALLREGDLLFARQSLVLSGAGKCVYIKEIIEPTVFESHIIRLRFNEKIVFSEFVYYYFNSYYGRKKIESIVEQVAAAGIRGSDLVKLKIPLPPLETQQKIAKILSSLDEKIELNNKINANLEEQAQAILKSWFVDFEPFGGVMPNDWEYVNISDICNVKGGKRLPKGNLLSKEKNSHPYIKVKDLNNLLYVTLNNEFEYVDDVIQEKIRNYTVSSGDIIISIVGTIGLISMVSESLNNANLTENCVKLIDFKISNNYLLFMLKSDYCRQCIKENTVGAVQMKLPIKNIQSIPIINPNEKSINNFDGIVAPILHQIEINQQETETLSQLRNTLLPKLMNGEIDVDKVVV